MPIDRKRLVGGLAFAGAVVGGGVAGAMLGTPSPSGAATALVAQQEDDGEVERAPLPGLFGHHLDLEAAADALGLTPDELQARLEDGDTIAEVAAAEGVDVQDVVDAMVEAGEAAIDEMAAEMKEGLPEAVERLVDGELPPMHGHLEMHEWVEPLARLDVAAETLGMSEDDLLDALRDGSSLADIAEDQGVEVDALVQALVREARSQIDDAVADGDLDDETAAELRDGLEERIRDRVEGEGFPMGGGFEHHRPPFGPGFGPGFGPRG